MTPKQQTQAIEKQAQAIRQEREDLVLELSEAEYNALDTQDKVDYLTWEFRQRMY